MDKDERNALIAAGIVGLLFIAMAAAPSVPQWPGYHDFAADRDYFGVPNFWNVVSNLAFICVACLGRHVLREGSIEGRIFIAGVLLTGLGSAYYHWQPDNARLFWDRLPMTIAFGAVAAALVGQRINPGWGAKILWPMVALGALSAVYWRWTENAGKGNLVPYGVVQFGTVALAFVVQVMFPRTGREQKFMWCAFAFYALAKALEMADRQIAATLEGIGGHPLKHVAAGGACYFLFRALFDAPRKV